jgi:glyoxylate utilization-related uncharacterized protein
VADHALALPTSVALPDRLFTGQRFSRHVAEGAAWSPWRIAGVHIPGFESCDVGISDATAGLANVCVVKTNDASGVEPVKIEHAGEVLFLCVLEGVIDLDAGENGTHCLRASDSVAIPKGAIVSLRATGSDCLRFLMVAF